jgi:hypothetical protein
MLSAWGRAGAADLRLMTAIDLLRAGAKKQKKITLYHRILVHLKAF